MFYYQMQNLSRIPLRPIRIPPFSIQMNVMIRMFISRPRQSFIS